MCGAQVRQKAVPYFRKRKKGNSEAFCCTQCDWSMGYIGTEARSTDGKSVLKTIVTSLRRIQEEGGQGNFVVFIADAHKDYYIQFAAEAGETELYGEAVGNENLNPQHALDESQIMHLQSLGWDISPGDAGNHSQVWQVTTDKERQRIAETVVQTFIGVYGIHPDETMEVNLVLQ
jgi:hypothetical protein